VFPGGGAVARVPRDRLGFDARQAPFNYVVHSKWSDHCDDDPNIPWTRGVRAALTPFATGGVYLNFIGDEGAGPCARRLRAHGVRPPADAQGPLRPEQRPAPHQNVTPGGAMAGIATSR
jgi:hypothetical protein